MADGDYLEADSWLDKDRTTDDAMRQAITETHQEYARAMDNLRLKQLDTGRMQA